MLSIKFVKPTKPTWLYHKGHLREKSPIEYQIMVNGVRVGLIWKMVSEYTSEYVVWWKLSNRTSYPKDMKFIFSCPAARLTSAEDQTMKTIMARVRRLIRKEAASLLFLTEKNFAYVEAAVFDAESGHLALLPTAPVLKPGQKLFVRVPK